MRGQASKVAEPLLDHTRAALRRPRGVLGLIALALLVGSADPAIAANQGDLILNEFNAVSDSMWLAGKTFLGGGIDVDNDEIAILDHGYDDQQGPFQLTTTGTLPGGLALDTDYYIVNTGLVNTPASQWFGLSLTPGGAKVNITSQTGGLHTLHPGDTYFGVVQGNGGNWIELVVIADHLDIRGWTLEFQNADPPPPPPENCNAGTVIFEAAYDIWADLRSGTIITVAEELPDDLSYDPAGGDWWINAHHEGGAVNHTNCFKVDNDNWRMRIWDGAITCTDPEAPPVVCTGVGPTVVIQDWVGEGQSLWGSGGSVGNDEVGKLEQDPSAAAATTEPQAPNYNDGVSSTFSSENRWSGGTQTQDFSALRGLLGIPVPALRTKGAALLVGLLLGSVFWLFWRQRASGV
jgi:hypothetical protein